MAPTQLANHHQFSMVLPHRAAGVRPNISFKLLDPIRFDSIDAAQAIGACFDSPGAESEI